MELASTMFGGTQRGYSQPTQTHQTRITAVAAADSDEGEVAIQLPDQTVVTVPTLAPVTAGEPVIVELQNTKAVVVGKPGWGDALRREDMDIRADLTVAEDSITALVEATASSGGSADEAYSIELPTQAARLTEQRVYGAYEQDGTPTPDNPSEIRTVGSPVRCDYFRHAASESAFWYSISTSRLTWLDDGWIRVTASKESTAGSLWTNIMPKAQAWVDPAKQYTMLIEYRHLTADGYTLIQNPASNSRQLSCGTLTLVPNEEGASAIDESGAVAFPMLYRTTFSGNILAWTSVAIAGSATTLTVELRISIIEDYAGQGYLPEDAIGIALDRPNILRNADTCPDLVARTRNSWERGEWSPYSSGNGTRAAVDIADPPMAGIARGYQVTGHTSGATHVGQCGLPLEKGRSYQIAVWARCLTPGSVTRLDCKVYGMSTDNSGTQLAAYASGELDNAWHLVTMTFNYDESLNPDDLPILVEVGCYSSASYPDIQMCGFRVFEHVETIPIGLDGNTLAALPDGTRDVLAIDEGGAVTLTKAVLETAQAATIGVTGTVGTDVLSSTGAIADGAQVLYKAATTQEINLGTVGRPELPDTQLTWSVAASIPASGECSWLTYFGVMAGGDYASKAELAITEGQIRSDVAATYATQDDVTELSSTVTQTAEGLTSEVAARKALETSGRNLLRGTEDFTVDNWALTRSTVPETGIVRITPTTSSAQAKYKVDYLDFTDYAPGEYTISVDARLADVESSYDPQDLRLYIGYSSAATINATFAAASDRYGFKSVGIVTGEWQRYSASFTLPDDFTAGTDAALVAGSQLTAQFLVPNRSAPVEVRRPMLVRGDNASLWTPAPEDMASEATVQEVSTRVTQNSNNITSLITDVDGVQTMIRAYSGGVLVGKPPASGTSGTSVCALVSASGEFDVVLVTWSRTTTDDPWEPQSYVLLSTQTDDGLVVYDGAGTTDDHIRAEFTSSAIRLLPESTDENVEAMPVVVSSSNSSFPSGVGVQDSIASMLFGSSAIFSNGKRVYGTGRILQQTVLRLYPDGVSQGGASVSLDVDTSDLGEIESTLSLGADKLTFNLAPLYAPMFCQAQGSASASIGTSVTQIPLTTAQHSSTRLGGPPYVDASSGGVVIQAAGLYRISAGIYYSAGGTAYNGVYVRKGANGAAFASATEVMSFIGNAGAVPIFGGTQLVRCDAGDILYLAGRCGGQAGTASGTNKATFLLVEFMYE